jgi:hypothetical protein
MNNTTSTASGSLGRGIQHLLIVLALALAALLVPLAAPVAHAAPPELTASENPVVIDLVTKKITLTWSLTPVLQLAQLTVTESGAPAPVLDQTVSCLPCTGTVPLTVTLGKTYTAQLSDALKKPLGAPLTITTTKAPIAAPGLGCKVDCITSAKAEEHGDWAHFTITTNSPASITLELSPMKEDENGQWEVSGPVVATAVTSAPTQNWTPTLGGLAPNTRYQVVLRARDGWDNEYVEDDLTLETHSA